MTGRREEEGRQRERWGRKGKTKLDRGMDGKTVKRSHHMNHWHDRCSSRNSRPEQSRNKERANEI